MNPETVRLFVPYSADPPWIVRREVARVGTFSSRAEAVSAAVAMRSKLTRAWGRSHPPVRVQESDGSWRDLAEVDRTAAPDDLTSA
jgi:hypothetical protein